MTESNIKIEFTADTSKALKKLESVHKAAEKLVIEMKKLENIEIGISAVSVNRKWWQFWK